MATLVFSAIGTLVAGPIGGVIGAIAGQQVDAAVFGGSSAEGPKLKDLAVTTSSYGSPIPRHFGRMRASGSIIWATDLVEHQSTSGGGKGKPTIKTYSYTTSFAVALASRPITGIGRIWADGNLLRGTAGDLKVGGAIRVYTGQFDQAPDPLIAAAEGPHNCPAFRGTAYVVFEDLQLADYGNRIPTLSFEILADTGTLTLAHVFDGVLENVDASVTLDGVAGFSCEGSLGTVLSQFQPVFPMDCDAGGERLTISRDRLQFAPIMLSDAAVSDAKGDFGANAGFSRKRVPLSPTPTQVLRYYDVDLDYQSGSQRAPGQASAGHPKTVDVPAAMNASAAFQLISRASRTENWARQSIAWRVAQLDPAIAPGTIVAVPGQAGQWRVNDWEWRASGVELSLSRIAPARTAGNGSVSPGRANLAADIALSSTHICAFELPWNGVGDSNAAALFAAVSASSSGWSGSALYVDQGDGALAPIGTSGRQRSVIGTVLNTLAPASPSLIDRTSSLTVSLLGSDMILANASLTQLADGANRALVGEEIIQFARAIETGSGEWRLETLLRGRGGTEAAIGGHAGGESFVLLDDRPVNLDASLVGSNPNAKIAALGLGDTVAAETAIACRGISLRPLSPVHPRILATGDGGMSLSWTRRARGAWQWLNGVDAPLTEQAEAYEVFYGPSDNPVARWEVGDPSLTLSATTLAALTAKLENGALYVRQLGTYAFSENLLLAELD